MEVKVKGPFQASPKQLQLQLQPCHDGNDPSFSPSLVGMGTATTGPGPSPRPSPRPSPGPVTLVRTPSADLKRQMQLRTQHALEASGSLSSPMIKQPMDPPGSVSTNGGTHAGNSSMFQQPFHAPPPQPPPPPVSARGSAQLTRSLSGDFTSGSAMTAAISAALQWQQEKTKQAVVGAAASADVNSSLPPPCQYGTAAGPRTLDQVKAEPESEMAADTQQIAEPQPLPSSQPASLPSGPPPEIPSLPPPGGECALFLISVGTRIGQCLHLPCAELSVY